TPPAGTFQQVSAGGSHTCGIKANGQVVCWGLNSSEGRATSPTGTFHQVSAGATHTCGIKTNGQVVCWGGNRQGQATPP
ncbi:MAG: RCC1 domain-containing protein, partial [Chloroflexota bacterium]|nr:RCC1 domain-containing protein [Chloroflexota bacterium]